MNDNPMTYGEQLAQRAALEIVIDQTISSLFNACANDLIYSRTVSWLAGRAGGFVSAANIAKIIEPETRDFWLEVFDAWEDYHFEQSKAQRGTMQWSNGC